MIFKLLVFGLLFILVRKVLRLLLGGWRQDSEQVLDTETSQESGRRIDLEEAEIEDADFREIDE